MNKDSIYDYTVKDSEMQDVPISSFKEKVLLVVNVASECGFTYQYKGLQDLYEKHKESGLEVLGFPCNQFRGQESGTNEEIQIFCSEKYDVSFKIFNKINVNGDKAEPFYDFLKKEYPGILGTKNIKWNFSKFLVNKDGKVVNRYGPTTKPKDIELDIIKLL
jgi:glutathione peroxidase